VLVVDPGAIGGLEAAVANALADPADASRTKLAHRYLGDLSTPPIDRFLSEVDRTLELVRSTRSARELPTPAETTEQAR
jgi:hypothetical protein